MQCIRAFQSILHQALVGFFIQFESVPEQRLLIKASFATNLLVAVAIQAQLRLALLDHFLFYLLLVLLLATNSLILLKPTWLKHIFDFLPNTLLPIAFYLSKTQPTPQSLIMLLLATLTALFILIIRYLTYTMKFYAQLHPYIPPYRNIFIMIYYGISASEFSFIDLALGCLFGVQTIFNFFFPVHMDSELRLLYLVVVAVQCLTCFNAYLPIYLILPLGLKLLITVRLSMSSLSELDGIYESYEHYLRFESDARSRMRCLNLIASESQKSEQQVMQASAEVRELHRQLQSQNRYCRHHICYPSREHDLLFIEDAFQSHAYVQICKRLIFNIVENQLLGQSLER